MFDDLDSKNIYLRKDNEIIGLHAVGYRTPYVFDVVELDGTRNQVETDFMELEKWGNHYNEEFERIGRGSFRIFDATIEDTAKEFENDGWIKFEGPK